MSHTTADPSAPFKMPQNCKKAILVAKVEELTSDEEFVEAEEEHQPQYDSDGDEIPDVDDINIDNKNNRANCISSNIDKVAKFFQVWQSDFFKRRTGRV